MNRINFDKHSKKYSELLDRLIRNNRLQMNSAYIDELEYKLSEYEELIDRSYTLDTFGVKTEEYINSIEEKYIEVKELKEKMNDKFLLFVVGTGNYGKSTLINAILQEEVAPVDFRPKTWKIDVYYLDDKNSGKVIIKQKDGECFELKWDQAISFIEKEEEKMEKSLKNYNKIKNNELKRCKTKDERNEMIEKLSKEYIYKSKIAEVRWPIKENKFLKNMMLVDTPGLTQEIYEINNSIKDYYFKADGVLWMLDAQTISAKNSEKIVKELESYLEDVGGINNNIIGVVNKIDKVIANGGQAALENIMKDAKRFFGDKFKYIVPISSKDAFKNSEDEGLKNLNKTIEKVFLDDSNSIKLQSKKIGVEKIIKNTITINNEFNSYIDNINNQYNEKKVYIDEFVDNTKNSIEKDINKLIERHMKRVNSNIETYTRNLFDIRDKNESKKYVLEKILNLDVFEENLKCFISSKTNLLNIEADKLYLNCELSQYKHINHLLKNNSLIVLNNDLTLEVKQEFDLYTSLGDFSMGSNIINFIGSLVNEFYKGIVKFFKMGFVKDNLREIMNSLSDNARKNILESLNKNINNIKVNSENILNKSYENILFSRSEFKFIGNRIKEFNKRIIIKNEISLKDIFY
ncbi:dynamin family protein [Clostridium perfringens]|nr:dynamin family protein [Clostridium perfringens]